MGTLADDVEELESAVVELEENNKRILTELEEMHEVVTELRQELIQANLKISYYESIYHDLKTAWKVRQRMEDV